MQEERERQARQGTCCGELQRSWQVLRDEAKIIIREVFRGGMWANSWQPQPSPRSILGSVTQSFASFLFTHWSFLWHHRGDTSAVMETPSPPTNICIHHKPVQLSSCCSCFRVSFLLTYCPLLLSIPFSSESPPSTDIPTGNQHSQTLLIDSRCSSPPAPPSLCLPVLGISFPFRLVCCHTLLPLQLQ